MTLSSVCHYNSHFTDEETDTESEFGMTSPLWHLHGEGDKLLCRFTTGYVTGFQSADEELSMNQPEEASTLTRGTYPICR